VPTEEANPLEALVRIQLTEKPHRKMNKTSPSEILMRYEARFIYPPEVKEPDISPRFEREPYQYMLVVASIPTGI
jgi:hypothetical protein